MKIVGFPNPSGSAYWRLRDPFKHLQKMGIDARVSEEGITEEIARWADVYVVQQCVDKEGIALLYAYQQEFGKKLVVEADDYPWVDDTNPFKVDHQAKDAAFVVTQTMKVADLITCTTDHLAEKLSKINRKVTVLPNYLDLDRWDLPNKLKNDSDTIRIGWAGSITHLEDLKMLHRPLRRVAKEFPNVRYIFVGETRVGEIFPDLPVDIIPGVPFETWPSRLHGLRLDIGLAPLRDTEFNRCKSRIKWMEYAVAKIPGVFSPTVYQFRGFDGSVGMIAENEDQWYNAIKNLILSEVLRADITDAAYTFVTRRLNLAKHAHEWADAYVKI
jgi:glycosyltransferase involved in cell wall biosynthesis